MGPEAERTGRRAFLGTTASVAMGGGLLAGYGTFAAIAGRFLYPARPETTTWMFVAEVGRLRPGDSLSYTTPAGKPVTITRQDDSGRIEDFRALSSTCPHLGCQVFWEPQNDRFFCPCHNGTFDPTGVATGGPPGEAGQSLPEFPLRIEGGLLFIEVPVERLSTPVDDMEGTI